MDKDCVLGNKLHVVKCIVREEMHSVVRFTARSGWVGRGKWHYSAGRGIIIRCFRFWHYVH